MLKSIAVNAPAAAKSKSDVPVHSIRGTKVERLNHVSTELKELAAEEKQLKTEISRLALDKIYDLNLATPNNTVDSVKIKDDSDNVVRVSNTSKYKIADGELADALFEGMGRDVNDYAIQTTKVAFDSGVFVKDEEFQLEVYNAINDAMAAVTAQLIADGHLAPGTANPLTAKIVVLPKPSFHKNRWTEFPTLEEQRKITKALPNTVQVVPNAKL